jgi:hypothetical protein
MTSTEPVDTLDVLNGRLPFYTHDGEIGTGDIPVGYTRAGVDSDDGRELYTYDNDVRGQGPTGAPIGDRWTVYEGLTQARVDIINADTADSYDVVDPGPPG